MSNRPTDPELLLSEVSEALRSMPGATALVVFGSLAEGRGDALSDVDLVAVSDDLEASIAARHVVLNRVAPLSLEWTIEPSRDAWAATYMFAGTSPLHKLDLGIVPRDDVNGALVWCQPSAHSSLPVDEPVTSPYAPAPGTVDHYVAGHFLGATRYVKARRRGNDLLCWRFASALLDATISLHYSKACRAPFLGRGLTSTEYLELDARLDPVVREQMLGRMRLAPTDAMDRSVRSLMNDMLHTSTDLGASIPTTLIAQFMSFFDVELGQI